MQTGLPVTFNHANKKYEGTLVKVSGGASVALYHLYVKGYYQGQLVQASYGWQFTTQKAGLVPELSEHFGGEVDRFNGAPLQGPQKSM